MPSTYSDRGRRPEGGLPGVFFASPDWDCNDCCEKLLPEKFNRGPIPISTVSTARNTTSLTVNLSHCHSQPFMIRSNASIAKRKSSSVDHTKHYHRTCSDSTGPAADARRDRQQFGCRRQHYFSSTCQSQSDPAIDVAP